MIEPTKVFAKSCGEYVAKKVDASIVEEHKMTWIRAIDIIAILWVNYRVFNR